MQQSTSVYPPVGDIFCEISRKGKGNKRIKKSGSTFLTIGFVIQEKNDPKGPFFNNGATA